MSDTPALPDGTYDAFVVDADDEGAELVHLSVTILAGDHKGEVVELAARGMQRDSIDLVGMPATLTVAGGSPSLQIDDP